MEMLEETVSRAVGAARFHLTLLALFAGLALTLAVVGLYGVVSYLISKRTREIGIRIALGAHATDVVRLVVAQGVRPVVAGLFLGLVSSFWTTRVLGSLLYNVSPQDVSTLGSATVLLVVVATVAILLPVRRAMSVSPTEALRAQ
jgi:ABC-type antimicrobial peptide transport system permease subunit